MEISKPQFNHIRLDTYPNDIKFTHTVYCKNGFHCFLSNPSEKFPRHIITFRYQAWFFKVDTNQELASYLGEVHSVVEDFSHKDFDLAQLKLWVHNVFNDFTSYLKANLPYFDFREIQSLDYSECASHFLSALESQGLYNTE